MPKPSQQMTGSTIRFARRDRELLERIRTAYELDSLSTTIRRIIRVEARRLNLVVVDPTDESMRQEAA